MSTLLLLSNPVLSEHYVLLIFVWKRDLGVTLKGEFYTEIREFLINISFFTKVRSCIRQIFTVGLFI